MNKEAFDLLLEKASSQRFDAGANLQNAQQRIKEFLAEMAQRQSTLHGGLRDTVTQAAMSPQEISRYGVDPGRYGQLAERLAAHAKASPALKYEDMKVTTNPLPFAGLSGVMGGLAGATSAFATKRLRPLARLLGVGGAGVGAGVGLHSGMSANRDMTKVKHMVGSEYGLRSPGDFNRVAPIVVPSQREALLKQYQ